MRSLVPLWSVCVLLSVGFHGAVLPSTVQPSTVLPSTIQPETSPAPSLETRHQGPHSEPTPSRPATATATTPAGTPTTPRNKHLDSTVQTTATETPKSNESQSAGEEGAVSGTQSHGHTDPPAGAAGGALNSSAEETVTNSSGPLQRHERTTVSTGQPSSKTSPDPSSKPSAAGPSDSSSPQPHSSAEPVVISNAPSTNSTIPPSSNKGLNSPTGTSVPSSQASPTDPGTHAKTPTPTAPDRPSSKQTVRSATEPVTTPGPASSTRQNSVTDNSTAPGPVSTSEASSTSEPRSPSAPEGSSTSSLSSTTGLTSSAESTSTTGVISTSSAVSTTINSTNSSGGVLPPGPERLPIPITKLPPVTSKKSAPKDPSGAGVQPCPPALRDGVVSQCLIAIAALAGVATIFMVSTIALCTKLSAGRHRYRVREANPGTEMVCISALLPERSNTYGRQRNSRSNGALISTLEGDSDEDGGDTLTLNSFLPENDRVV